MKITKISLIKEMTTLLYISLVDQSMLIDPDELMKDYCRLKDGRCVLIFYI